MALHLRLRPTIMALHLRLRPTITEYSGAGGRSFCRNPTGIRNLRVYSCSFSARMDAHKLVVEVKEKLAKDYSTLPMGKNGRDDEEMILWFLKDRKFSVDDTVSKLAKAMKWRREFGVSELTEKHVKSAAETGKSYVHGYLDVQDRPVLMVDVSKHIPGDFREDEKLCVFLIEKALSKLPPGQNQILIIVDLRGFGAQNADLRFITFLFDAFYYYYPRRLGEVLLVDAPFIFKPVWQMLKPMLKSYASLVKFCSVNTVRDDYFTDETLPSRFRN